MERKWFAFAVLFCSMCLATVSALPIYLGLEFILNPVLSVFLGFFVLVLEVLLVAAIFVGIFYYSYKDVKHDPLDVLMKMFFAGVFAVVVAFIFKEMHPGLIMLVNVILSFIKFVVVILSFGILTGMVMLTIGYLIYPPEGPEDDDYKIFFDSRNFDWISSLDYQVYYFLCIPDEIENSGPIKQFPYSSSVRTV